MEATLPRKSISTRHILSDQKEPPKATWAVLLFKTDVDFCQF